MYSFEEAQSKSLEYFGGNDLAVAVFDKYRLKDEQDNIMEASPEEMHRREARELARVEAKKKRPLSEGYIFGLLDKFKWLIPQGSPMSGLGNKYQYVSLSNCFVIDPPEDSYGGILKTDQELVQISKRRGGVGTDLSKLRPAKTRTTNAARTSTGIGSFMERYSNSTREVGQDGRRGALMLSVSVHHPDILTFVTKKNDNVSVTGANISVRLSDEFLRAVQNDEDYELRWPVESKSPKVSRKISARKVWKEIIHSAWLRAEPGLLFWDNILNEGVADYYVKSVSTNPCAHGHMCVLTPNGQKLIKDVEPNDIVWSEHGWSRVINKFYNGKKPVFSYNTKDGHIWLTNTHKVVSKGEKTEVWKAKSIDLVDEDRASDIVEVLTLLEESDVYDLTVGNPTNTYWCNGFNISNCAEIPMPPNESCRLFAINLFPFVVNPFTSSAYFDKRHFFNVAYQSQILMDDLVELEIEAVDRIITKIESDPEPDELKQVELNLWRKIRQVAIDYRRTGLGYTAMGDCLAALGIKYGNEESIEMAGEIAKILKFASYSATADLAEEFGPFKGWSWEVDKNIPYLQRFADEYIDFGDGYVLLGSIILEKIKTHGRRNIANLTNAPTGSVSQVALLINRHGTTSGIEPAFSIDPYTRRKKINPGDKNTRVDFVDQNGDKWQNYKVYPANVQEWIDVTGETDLEKSPWYGACAPDIDWVNRVRLQAEVQKHIDHSISSTINLPNDVTEEKVAEIYEAAWKYKLKGLTVYRDGCRSGVLVKEEKPEKPNKRPHILPANFTISSVKGQKYLVAVGLHNKEPYEVFAGRLEEFPSALTIKTGYIKKNKRGHYSILDNNLELILDNITEYIDDTEEALTRMVSTSLRHSIPIEYTVDQLSKITGELNSFSKVVARTLKQYIKDGTKSGETCPQCGERLIFSEGCCVCAGPNGCGFSKCG